MAGVFIICITISVICQTAEFKWLNEEYESCSHLRISYMLKLIAVVPAIGTAVAMALSTTRSY
jgi:hypothetical protein